MIDLGCGNGVMLRAFHEAYPEWAVAGAELSDKYRASVESIPNCEKLYTCAPRDLPGAFDVITMVHSLEHIIGPVDYLKAVREKLKPGGLLVAQVPDMRANPFEIVVADHTSHCTPSGLRTLVGQAGYEVVHLADDWVPKELSLVARASSEAIRPVAASGPEAQRSTTAVRQNLDWLGRTVAAARRLAAQGHLGILGTSIAATWLAAELDGSQAFFVDEDPSRPGADFMGRPVVSPEQVQPGSRVFVGLPPAIATRICERLNRPDVGYIAPPPLAE
jgi:SAM-dependent methyltransferase